MTSSGAAIPHTSDSGTGFVMETVELPSSVHVRINEVMWMGSDLSTADEWIELVAVSTGAVMGTIDLHGWTITAQKDTGEAVIANLNGLRLGSGQYLVISNFPALTSRLRNEPDVVSSGLSIPNTKLLLRLRDESGALIDEVDDFVGAPFAGANPSGGTKASMERVNPLASGIVKENWITATTSNGFDLGANVRGTPGFENGSVSVPDTAPPSDVTHAYAYLWSGSVMAGWMPSTSSDVTTYRLTAGDVRLEVGASTTTAEFALTGSHATVMIQAIDDSANISTGTVISFQPLQKLKISEVLPAPMTGNDEWIEIGNFSDVGIDLQGISVSSGTKTVSLKTVSSIHPHLSSGSTLVLPSTITGLSFPNAGGVVRLKAGSAVIDEWVYPALPTGVSQARFEDRVGPLCTPTPGRGNQVTPLDPQIVVQDGTVTGTEPVTLNLALQTMTGSLEGATCHWDFGDGFMSSQCNPSAHRMTVSGEGNITASITDYCGNTVERLLPFSIVKKPESLSKISEMQPGPACIPSAFSGVVLSEFIPDPEGDEAEGEWMEIRSISNRSLHLCGWSVDDQIGGSDPYRLDRYVVGSGEYLLLPRSLTGIALNNDRDTVRLIAPMPRGGTGVIMLLPYQDSATGESFALREDAQWLATQYPTPGTANRFEEIDLSLAASPVILRTALPNPKGKDTFDEYIELENLTMYPQWLNGWFIENKSGKRLSLQGNVIPRKTTIKIKLRKTGFTLGNTVEALKLIDSEGRTRSVLAWEKAKESKRYHPLDDTRQVASEIEASTLLGIGIPDNTVIKNEYINTISTLIKNKKLELEIDSKVEETVKKYAWVEGVDVQSMLLRSGLAYVSHEHPFSRRLEYEVYEQEARDQKRGIWATDESADAAEQHRDREAILARYDREGLVLQVTPVSGLVGSGTLLKTATNLPADIFIMTESGVLMPLPENYRITSDLSMSFVAQLQVESASGEYLRSAVTTQEYVIPRAHYPACIIITEVYPSPNAGEREWVELYNKCDQEVQLAGWSVDDESKAGSKPFILGMRIVKPGSYLVLSGSSLPISLNNSGDEVSLRTPAGSMSDHLRFSSVKKGMAYARKGELFCLTARPTPGMDNECVHMPARARKTSPSPITRLVIGLGRKYVSEALFSGFEVGNIDNSIMEGLNLNYRIQNVNNESPNNVLLFALVIGGFVGVFIALVMGWRR